MELSKPPRFSTKTDGKWIAVSDFTQGNATLYRRHKMELKTEDFHRTLQDIFGVDLRLQQLAASARFPDDNEPTFSGKERFHSKISSSSLRLTVKYPEINSKVCDWDKENIPTVVCEACGDAKYCDDCDEILHR